MQADMWKQSYSNNVIHFRAVTTKDNLEEAQTVDDKMDKDEISLPNS